MLSSMDGRKIDQSFNSFNARFITQTVTGKEGGRKEGKG